MKKLICLILALALTLSLTLPASATKATESVLITYRGITVVLDGAVLSPTDANGNAVEPFIMDGSTYLPLRAIAGALGLGVDWDDASSTVTLSSGGEKTAPDAQPSLSSGSKTVDITYRNIKIVLDGTVLSPTDVNGDPTEPFIMGDSTYLPLRAIAGALGLEVDWDAASSTVRLTSAAADTVTITTVHSYDRAGETPISVTVRRENYSGGLLISAETWDSEGQMLSTESYVYNSEGLLQSHSVDATGEDADRLTTYTYENGLLSRADTYTGRSTPGVHSIRGFYSYDEAGRLINLYVHYPNASWDNTDYSYDSTGLLLRSESHGYDILRNSHYSSYTDYFYDSSGTLLRSEAPGSATEYFYGSDGRLAKTVAENLDGTFTVVSYTYSD